MPYRRNTYRWFLYRLSAIWAPRGIFNYTVGRFKPLDWHKNIFLSAIKETRELLDQLEQKILGSQICPKCELPKPACACSDARAYDKATSHGL